MKHILCKRAKPLSFALSLLFLTSCSEDTVTPLVVPEGLIFLSNSFPATIDNEKAYALSVDNISDNTKSFIANAQDSGCLVYLYGNDISYDDVSNLLLPKDDPGSTSDCPITTGLTNFKGVKMVGFSPKNNIRYFDSIAFSDKATEEDSLKRMVINDYLIQSAGNTSSALPTVKNALWPGAFSYYLYPGDDPSCQNYLLGSLQITQNGKESDKDLNYFYLNGNILADNMSEETSSLFNSAILSISLSDGLCDFPQPAWFGNRTQPVRVANSSVATEVLENRYFDSASNTFTYDWQDENGLDDIVIPYTMSFHCRGTQAKLTINFTGSYESGVVDSGPITFCSTGNEICFNPFDDSAVI